MKLRRASASEIVAIDAAIFKISGPPSAEELEKSAWWVAVDGSDIVAYAGVWVKADKKAGYHTRAGVLPAYRGQGLQKRLLRVREAHARKHGCVRCYTYVYAHNHASTASLIKCGYFPYHFEDQAYLWLQKALVPGFKLKAYQAPDYQD